MQVSLDGEVIAVDGQEIVPLRQFPLAMGQRVVFVAFASEGGASGVYCARWAANWHHSGDSWRYYRKIGGHWKDARTDPITSH
jgi:hypothetical protein